MQCFNEKCQRATPTKRSSKQRLPNTSGILPSGRRVLSSRNLIVVDFVPETRLHTCVLEHLHKQRRRRSNQTVFQAPIKRRASGTPVINVTFNGTQQFEMIVDTGPVER